MPCNKRKCLKQVNPDIPDVYFGVPFEKDENWYACYLCELEEKRKGKQTKFLISNRFTRMAL